MHDNLSKALPPLLDIARAAVLTDNAMEAADIDDYLSQREIVPVATYTNVLSAIAAIDTCVIAPNVTFFGFDVDTEAGDACLNMMLARGWSVILINGYIVDARLEALPRLVRPFGSIDLDCAFRLATDG